MLEALANPSVIMLLLVPLIVGGVAVGTVVSGGRDPRAALRGLTRPGTLAAFGLLAVAALGMEGAVRSLNLKLRKDAIYAPDDRLLRDIPSELDGYTRVGPDRIESAEIVEQLGTTNYVSRLYVPREQPGGGERAVVIDFHAAYYTNQIDTVPHVPERCFVGGGMQAADSRVLRVPVDTTSWYPDPTVPPEFAGAAGAIYTTRLSNNPQHTSGSPGARVRLPRDLTPEGLPDGDRSNPLRMRVSEFIDATTGSRVISGYFFIANGGWVPSANQVRTLSFDLTSRYAYYCKVQFTSSSFPTVEAFAEGIAPLAGELLGEIMLSLPPWVEVQRGEYPEEARPS